MNYFKSYTARIKKGPNWPNSQIEKDASMNWFTSYAVRAQKGPKGSKKGLKGPEMGLKWPRKSPRKSPKYVNVYAIELPPCSRPAGAPLTRRGTR